VYLVERKKDGNDHNAPDGRPASDLRCGVPALLTAANHLPFVRRRQVRAV